MRNITVAVSDETYRLARVWAAGHDTSVSAVVQYLLQTLPGIARASSAFPAARSRPDAPSRSPAVSSHPVEQ
jgi:hypothetical protein